MKPPILEGKRVLVVGLARSGVAAANFLGRKGALVSVTDSKTWGKLEEAVGQLQGNPRLLLGRHDENVFLESDLIVLSPGVPSDLLPLQRAHQAGIPIWSEVELAYRFLSGPLLGVTGSNGKTTTTALLGAIFKQAGSPATVAGNIGTALTGTLEEAASMRQTWIVELSSFQLENIHQLRCHIAVLLNLSPDHQDRYRCSEDYQAAKARIFQNQTPADFSVGNADDPAVVRLVSQASGRQVWFSRRRLPRNGAGVEDGTIIWNWEGKKHPLMPANRLGIKGNHNLENALAAVSAACLSQLPFPSIVEALETFRGVEHRLEWVRELRGVQYFNDSKATNVESTRVALSALPGPLVVILGGLEKGQDFALLKEMLLQRARHLVLIGETADRLEALFGELLPCSRANSLEEAVETAASLGQPGDSVLLAPACASFDMFTNFEERGRVFKATVKALPVAGVKN